MGVRRGGQEGPPWKILPSPGKKSADAHDNFTPTGFNVYMFCEIWRPSKFCVSGRGPAAPALSLVRPCAYLIISVNLRKFRKTLIGSGYMPQLFDSRFYRLPPPNSEMDHLISLQFFCFKKRRCSFKSNFYLLLNQGANHGS
jgi:hypothetical protein